MTPRPRLPGRRRRRCRAVAAATALVTLACSGTADVAPTSVRTTALPACDPPARSRDRLLVWHPFTEAAHRDAFDAVLARFRLAHPGTPVDAVTVNAEELVARLSRAGAEDGPDAVVVTDGDLTRLADSGRTLPAEACLAAVAAPPAERFRPAVRATWSRHDVLWAVPYGATVPVLWYHQGRLAAAGRRPPTTPAELADTLADLRRVHGGPGLLYDLDLVWTVANRWSAQRGRPLVDRDASGRARAHLDRAEVRDDLVWLRDLDENGLIEPTGADSGGDDVLALNRSDATATLAVHTSASTGTARRLAASGDVRLDQGGLAPLPGPGGGDEPPPGGFGFVLLAGPRTDPRAATTLAAWFAEPAQQATVAAVAGLAPVVPGAEDQPELAALNTSIPAFGLAAARVRGAAVPAGGPPVRPGPEGELRRTVLQAWRVLLKGGDPDAVMAAAQDEARRLLDAYDAAHR